MNRLIKSIFQKSGYSLQRHVPEPNAGSDGRKIGNMKAFVEDIKARGVQIDSILDIGANKGLWTCDAVSIFPGASIFMIEPQVEMEPFLKDICASHNNIRYCLAAAGAENEERYLTIWDDLQGSSLLPLPENELKSNGKQRLVPVVTIDELLEAKLFVLPQLVKLDIQGFELEALKGASKLFGATEVFILETSLFSFDGMTNQPDFFEVISFMHKRGYLVYDFAGFLRRPYDGALGQVDLCFVKKDGTLRHSSKW